MTSPHSDGTLRLYVRAARIHERDLLSLAVRIPDLERTMATLLVSKGPAEGEQFAIGEHRLIMIGRDEGCTFQILDQQMSRRHVQVKRNEDSGTHAAIDFGSSNGVLINGTRIDSEVSLVDGDEIQIGETTLVYLAVDSPDAKTINGLMRKRGEGRRGTLLNE